MKKTILTVALCLSSGTAGLLAQSDKCNANSSVSHEAVKAGNFKDAYLPWKAVLKDCPTLRFYTFTDGFAILKSLLEENMKANGGKKSSAEYKKYFEELMETHDIRMKYIPDFQTRMKNVPSVEKVIGSKALDYLTYAPEPDNQTAYKWLSESVNGAKADAQPAVFHTFLDTSLQLLRANSAHKEQFIQDYLAASQYVEEALKQEEQDDTKTMLQTVKDNLVAHFINSGAADCESLQEIYAPKIEANKADLAYLKKVISIMRMMGCIDQEAYLQASFYAYQIEPTADAAAGCGSMAYKKGDIEGAVKFFNEAIDLESDEVKKAEFAYYAATVLYTDRKFSQAKSYAQKAIGLNANYGKAYILIAKLYASSPSWSDESVLNKCTYYVVLDKLQRAKSVDSSVSEEANKLISDYARYTPAVTDLFMLGYKAGDKITVGGWIGETTTVR